MAYAVVLDADVLHPYNLADLLLRLCERGLFRVAAVPNEIDPDDRASNTGIRGVGR